MMGRIYMDTQDRQDGLLGVSAVRTVDSGFCRNDGVTHLYFASNNPMFQPIRRARH